MIDINVMFSYLKSIISFSPLLAAIAALASCYVAWTVKNTNERRETAKFKSDLYCILTSLISFDHYLHMTYDTRNIATQNDAIFIINAIKNINKNTININNKCFYNDQLTATSLHEICQFFQEYTIWQGWKIINQIDVFRELRLIYSVRISLLTALKTLINDYESDERVNSIIGTLTNIDSITSDISHCLDSGKFIEENLSLIFYKDLFHKSYSTEEKQIIINCLFQMLLSGQIGHPPIANFLFNEEILHVELISTGSEISAIGKNSSFPVRDITTFLDSLKSRIPC